VPSPWINVAHGVIGVPDGGEIMIIAGTYTAADGNVFTAGEDGKAMMLTPVFGEVIIGQ